MNPAPNSGSVVKDFIQASTNSITSVNTSFIMSIILGSLFDDNNVTFESDSHTSWAWVKLVLSQVKIDVGNTAKDVSGFNNVISLKPRLIGLPPSGWHPQYYFATSISEWEKGETITITGTPIS